MLSPFWFARDELLFDPPPHPQSEYGGAVFTQFASVSWVAEKHQNETQDETWIDFYPGLLLDVYFVAVFIVAAFVIIWFYG